MVEEGEQQLFWQPKHQVLVAGAGPVGLYAALFLARHGVKVRIIDEQWRGPTRSCAMALHPRSLELLSELGLGESMLEGARRVHKLGLYDRQGRRTQMDLDRLPARFPFVAVLPQSDLEELLLEALEECDVSVEFGHRLACAMPREGHVDVGVDKLRSAESAHLAGPGPTIVESSSDIRVPFVIGADGRRSLVRQQLGIEFDDLRPAEDFIMFDFEAFGESEDEGRIVLDDETVSAIWPMSGNRYRATFQLRDVSAPLDSGQGRGQRRNAEDAACELADLRALLAQRAPWFSARICRLLCCARSPFEYRLASAFSGPGVFLAGDAGHTTSPVGVQSMNVGLCEVTDLCASLIGVLEGKTSQRELGAYSAQRRAEWKRLLGVDGFPLRPAEGADDWTRRRAERIVPCVPASGGHFAQLVSQIGLVMDAA